uniref:Uncharacterized protein n=1 Tax=Paramormyrops kingsleyae TaxID=1676925 RepID=A0A3B3RHA1_9TELE
MEREAYIIAELPILKNWTIFGQETYGLVLLSWFSQNAILLDNNGMREQNQGTLTTENSYGFHYFRNWEYLLDSLQNQEGCTYYTGGNLRFHRTQESLRNYVNNNHLSDVNWNLWNQINSHRIIVRINPFNYIDEVYITQHHNYETNLSSYNPSCTYRIGIQLIREISNMCPLDLLSRHRNYYSE